MGVLSNQNQVNPTDFSWWEYARSYDLLCETNYHYQDLLQKYESWLREEMSSRGLLDKPATICDIGAGTGNFLLRAAKIVPHARLIHWDWNSAMNDLARKKYNKAGIPVEIVGKRAAELNNVDFNCDVLLLVNALYSMPNRKQVLANCRRIVAPCGKIYIIDTGRPINPMAFGSDLFLYLTKQKG